LLVAALNALPGLLKSAATATINLFNMLFGASLDLGTKVKDIVVEAITALPGMLKSAATTAINLFNLIFGSDEDPITVIAQQLKNLLVAGLAALPDLLVKAAIATIDITKLIFGEQTADKLTETLKPFINSVDTFLTTIAAIIDNITIADIFASIRTFIDSLNDNIDSMIAQFTRVSTFFENFTFPNPFDKLKIPDSVKNAFSALGIDLGSDVSKSANEEIANNSIIPPTYDETTWTDAGENAGTSMGQGVNTGITDEVGDESQVEDTRNIVQKTWSKIWGSKSPSTYARDNIGKFIGQGILVGIQKSISDPVMVAKIQTSLTKLLSIGDTKTAGKADKYSAQITLFTSKLVEPLITAYSEMYASLDTLRSAFNDNTVTVLTEIYAELSDMLTNLYIVIAKDKYSVFYIDVLSLLDAFNSNYESKTDATYSALLTKLDNFINSTKSKFSSLYAQIEAKTNTFKNNMVGIFELMVTALVNTLNDLATRLVDKITQALTTVKNSFDGETEPAFQTGLVIGNSLADGVARGIEDKVAAIIRAVKSMIDKALGAAKDELNAHSPSRRTEKEIGIPFGKGVEAGIIKSFSSVESTLVNKINVLANKRIPALKVNAPTISGIAANYNSADNASNLQPLLQQEIQKSITAANQTAVVNNYTREFNLYMTVTPERASQVQKNFSVAEYIGV